MHHDPTTCHICQTGRAIGIGIGFTSNKDKDPRWVCAECSLILEDIRRIKRMDACQHKALDCVDGIAADFAASVCKTDIAAFDELERRMFWKAIVEGYGNALRDIIRSDAPF